MQIPQNRFACKYQGTLQMGQKVMIRFWWESGLSSESRSHLTLLLQTLHPLRMFKIAFRDSSLYPK